DIIVENDNLFGDGVNVAARLGEVAEPADIWISSAVYEQIAGKVSFPTAALGERNFKNIDRPGMWHHYQFNPEENRQAEECMRKAMALDPRLAYGHVELARVLNCRMLLDWSADLDAEQRLALEVAQRAVELDDKDPYCHYVFCLASRNAG